MTREEIINGLQFTVDMFLLDPTTGETLSAPRNSMDMVTIDACKEAIKLLKLESCEDAISRDEITSKIEEWADGFENGGYFSGSSVADAIRVCIGIADELPSVTPVQK